MTENLPDTNVGDMISRQAAIDALDKRFDSIPMEQTTEILLLRKDLRGLPSAQPERKKGEWIPVTNGRGGHECDQCHEYAPSWATGEEHLTNYCPNCGAKMDARREG